MLGSPESAIPVSHHRCGGLGDGRAGAADPGEAGWCPPHPENPPPVPAEPSPASLTRSQEAPGHPEDTPPDRLDSLRGPSCSVSRAQGGGPGTWGRSSTRAGEGHPPVLGRARPCAHHLHAFHQRQPHCLVPAQRHHAGRGLGGGLEEGDHGLHPHAAGLVMTSRWSELAPCPPGDQPGAHRQRPPSFRWDQPHSQLLRPQGPLVLPAPSPC